MTWHLGELAPFDTESTGTDVESDRIVSATVARIRPGQPSAGHLPPDRRGRGHSRAGDRRARHHHRSCPRQRCPGGAGAGVGGRRPSRGDARRCAGRRLEPVLRLHPAGPGVPPPRCATVEARLGRPIGPVVDVFVIDKALDRYRPGKRQLDALCQQYGVRLDGAHDAEADALAAARVAYRLGQRAQQALSDPLDVANVYGDRRYPERIVRGFQEFGKLTLAEVHAAQVGWYAEQAEGLAQYWRRQANDLESRAGRAADEAGRDTLAQDAAELRERADGVTTSWPIRPFGGARWLS